ncbi:hypothetical protein LZK98_16010 [Sphingomonas cannabina]|uniref:hypothetical protein n=1 Tax=Sphingomonas cannabina TaxID=2899123 RepID=UPI001F3D340C|nr:hypothetical protein [Sphingomonas cannabina]UIJ44552.1 hypothetical protein LZK98_16010 [Sphingomonas cannabina]
MTRSLLIAAASAMLFAGAPAFAAPCRDAHGKFVRCPTAAAKTVKATKTMTAARTMPAKTAKASPARCRLGGKFVKCGTPGSKAA